MIIRQNYLNWIIEAKDSEFIKVITGVRRSGKSFLLEMFREYLLSAKIKKENIIYINFEDMTFDHLLTAKALFDYLINIVTDDAITYFLFDEIQMVENWERVVNSLRVSFKSDIYVTGSNSNMLSGELATLLSGRTITIEMLPLSFNEFTAFKAIDEMRKELLYDEYIDFGGFPSVVLQSTNSLKVNALQGIFDTIVLNDVASRGSIREIDVLKRIVKFLLDNVGQLISPKKIADTLTSSNVKTSVKSISKYLNLLEEAFLFYKVERYDIHGKEHLKNGGKYFVVDIGLRNQILGRFAGNHGGQMENIVYLELRRLGYEIYVGRLDNKEVDFVAIKDGITKYIQVTLELPNNSRETDNLIAIKDSFQKIVITGKRKDVGMIDGVPIVYITDFLTNGLPIY
ncbi:MAG: ATP-binding protein [Clostridiales Family XIII bacterium]|jgi:predicted AAA+ superfamily ATPase|nr:ATP-binding protein [Clostridiales Family XIII bacterium]